MIKSIFCGVFITFIVKSGYCDQINKREKRFLLFPEASPTRHQLVLGVGLPVDLEDYSVTIGYAIKILHYLPYNATQLKPSHIVYERKLRSTMDNSSSSEIDPITGQKYEKYESDVVEIRDNSIALNDKNVEFDEEYQDDQNEQFSRWFLYEKLEELVKHHGFEGRSCIMRMICESSQVNFTYKNGILGELMHILLTPSTTFEEFDHHSDKEYYNAEKNGRSGSDCESVYNKCDSSLLEMFTQVFDPNDFFEFL